MIRPGLTFALWLAIVVFVVLNDMVGDTWIGLTLSVRAVEWYKALVPLPYVAMLALIHARRTAGPRWFEAALLAALLWPSSTVIVDFLYARFFYADDPTAFLDRFAFWWGAPYPLLVAGPVRLPDHRRRRPVSSSRPAPGVASRCEPAVIPTKPRERGDLRDLLVTFDERTSPSAPAGTPA